MCPQGWQGKTFRLFSQFFPGKTVNSDKYREKPAQPGKTINNQGNPDICIENSNHKLNLIFDKRRWFYHSHKLTTNVVYSYSIIQTENQCSANFIADKWSEDSNRLRSYPWTLTTIRSRSNTFQVSQPIRLHDAIGRVDKSALHIYYSICI